MHRTDWEIEEEDERAAYAPAHEEFDRVAFATRALALLRPPPRTTVAICEGTSRVHVSAGRTWGRPGERWAIVSVPPNASRRDIALAISEIAERAGPWALDVLVGGERDPEAAE